VALDKTYGYLAAPPSPDCCGFGSPLLSPDSAFVDVGGFESIGATATYQCTGDSESIFDSMTTWWSGNSAIAQVTKGQATGVSAGFTTANASGKILECSGNTEYFQLVEPSAPVTVTAIPVNFKLVSAEPANDNVTPSLEADFTWQSSDGKYADLNGCFIRENVTFPNINNGTCPSSAQNCFYPSSPPWAAKGTAGSGYANPTITSPGVGAVAEQNSDIDSVNNLNFVKPYSAAPFSGTQYFQYSCNGGTWTNLYGPVSINYSMATNSAGKWQVVVSRSDTLKTSVYLIPNQ
jgi:hypothetical protein